MAQFFARIFSRNLTVDLKAHSRNYLITRWILGRRRCRVQSAPKFDASGRPTETQRRPSISDMCVARICALCSRAQADESELGNICWEYMVARTLRSTASHRVSVCHISLQKTLHIAGSRCRGGAKCLSCPNLGLSPSHSRCARAFLCWLKASLYYIKFEPAGIIKFMWKNCTHVSLNNAQSSTGCPVDITRGWPD